MDVNLEGKKVLFIGPAFYDYHTLIKKKIQDLGANVTFHPEMRGAFFIAILNTVWPYLIVLNQKIYYYYLWLLIKDKDYTHFLLIRGYKFPNFFIKKIKAKNPNIECIMYQWDSNKNDPYYHLIDYFDKVYTFDYKDYKEQEKLRFLQLFYTEDIDKINKKEDAPVKYTFFCLSAFTLSRYQAILSFTDFCDKNNFKLKSYCYIPYKTYIKYKYLKRIPLDKNLLSFKSLPRNQYLEFLENSAIVVDFNHANQTGLSMRVIETYGARKKIFTTNLSILDNPIFSPSWVQTLDLERIEMPIYAGDINLEDMEDLSFDTWVKVLFS
ncbi:hypothetical protein [Pedobacter aquatilis]|uniref:hypothetical protein n=1 Tax=Pedobacter aquatilis TaxID=351343 RepID=UPI00292D6F45|nr:hypothetical protein [Pedobacter aquatilis]